MKNSEYFTSQFGPDCEPGMDDYDTMYALVHCEEKERFLLGFAEFIEENLNEFNSISESGKDFKYSIQNFVEWVMNHPEMVKELEGIKSWEDFHKLRGFHFEELEEKSNLLKFKKKN